MKGLVSVEINGSSDEASPRNKTFIFIQQAVIQQHSNILTFALRAKHKTKNGIQGRCIVFSMEINAQVLAVAGSSQF